MLHGDTSPWHGPPPPRREGGGRVRNWARLGAGRVDCRTAWGVPDTTPTKKKVPGTEEACGCYPVKT